MELASGSSQTLVLAKLIRALRQQKGLTAEALAAGNFSEQYVLALERGAVRPSVPALEALAHLLDAPVSELLAAPSEPSGELDIQALQEDIVYQTNVAKMLIRSGKVTEAMQLINEIDVYCQPYNESLPAGVAYLVPFLRGRAHLQRVAPEFARPELEAALAIAGGEPEAAARIRNLLGVVYFEMSQPRLALEQHLKCLLSIRTHVVSDINFRVNVYRNVAGDYWALNEPRQALGIYREIMPSLDDLDDVQQKALVYWGMASAHMALREWPETRLYCTKALQIYEECGNRDEAASLCLNVAETLVDDDRLEEARAFLTRASSLLEGTANQAIMSFLYRDLANLARRQSQRESASSNATRSVELARAYYESTRSIADNAPALFWQDPVRTYAEALEMGALIEEDQGHRHAADLLFDQALALIEPDAFEETRYAINLSYAAVLEARGDLRSATRYYRVAATLNPRWSRRGT